MCIRDRDSLKITPKDASALEASLEKSNISFQKTGGEYIVRLKHTADAIGIIEQNKENIAGMEVRRGSMDDVFLNITGSEVRN